jgi:hypothetical protein
VDPIDQAEFPIYGYAVLRQSEAPLRHRQATGLNNLSVVIEVLQSYNLRPQLLPIFSRA